MSIAIKIENLTKLDETSIQILRVLALKFGERLRGTANYTLIAKSLHVERDTVRKSVNRMIRKGILSKTNGELSIENAVVVMQS